MASYFIEPTFVDMTGQSGIPTPVVSGDNLFIENPTYSTIVYFVNNSASAANVNLITPLILEGGLAVSQVPLALAPGETGIYGNLNNPAVYRDWDDRVQFQFSGTGTLSVFAFDTRDW